MRRRSTALLAALCVGLVLAACGGSSSSGSSGSSSTSSAGSSSSTTSGNSSAAGNGLASESANAIVRSAAAAADGLKSVRVKGNVQEGGTQIGLDLQLAAGVGSVGWISESGHRVNLVTVGKTVYLNGNQAFWTKFGGAAAASLLAGRWLKGTETGSFAGLRKLATIHDLFNAIFSSYGKLAKGPTKVVGGAKAIAVTDTTKGGTIYVATTGKPYPLEILGTESGSSGDIAFSDFNAPVKITAPSGAIDLSQLESAG